jgi:hypothetical protein
MHLLLWLIEFNYFDLLHEIIYLCVEKLSSGFGHTITRSTPDKSIIALIPDFPVGIF